MTVQFPNYFMVLGPNAVAGSWGYTIGNQVSFGHLPVDIYIAHTCMSDCRHCENNHGGDVIRGRATKEIC